MARPFRSLRLPPAGPQRQRGVATLLVALCLLVILTIIILSSTNVALFEQKTTTNENREMVAMQAAEYALNVAGEYLKGNVVDVASTEANGWLESGGTALHWQSCAGITNTAHPCFAERDAGVRSQLYYYTSDGTSVTTPGDAKLNILTAANAVGQLPTAARLNSMGGTTGSAFNVATGTTVNALLCRLDTTPGSTPSCQTTPTTGNRIAITLVANSAVTNESAGATVKETWGTYSSFSAQAALPLVASGLVHGLGNASIVTAPNAGGYGIPGSIWSPNNVSIDGSGANGVGSVSTCHLGGYLGSVPIAQLQTTCAGNGNTGCGCSNVASDSPDSLSGHLQGGITHETADILDVDGDHGSPVGVPDIQFFPGQTSGGTWMDTSDPTDDNLFEWIFNHDVTGAADGTDNHGAVNYTAEVNYLTQDLGAETVAGCGGFNTSSSGLYYVTGTCDFGNSNVGSPDNPVVIVASGDAKLNGNMAIFGMLFIRDAGAGASLKGNGNVTVFGSVVVEGEVDLGGGLSIVYVENTAGSPGKKLPKTTRFARLPGSWLDSANGF